MTNQQGAPEALFYADALDRCAEVDFDHIFVPSAAVIRRLHAENERLAALVEAQQPAPAIPDTEAFQNFHRLLCARFGYVHDERDWRRDQLSLVEHIARQVQPSPTPQADSQTAPVLDYPPLPELDMDDDPIWSAILRWQAARQGSGSYAIRKANVESAIFDQMRAYADETYALRIGTKHA